MPITFETPGPVAPAVSSAYGAAEQFSRTLPTIASLYGQAAHAQQQAAQFQAGLTQQAMQAGADRQFQEAARQSALQEQGREQAAALGERQAEFAASRDVSPRDVFLTQAAAADAKQRAELQSWLSQQEVGQAERVRYQRMQAAVSSVLADDNLDEQDKRDVLTQLRTGIDPVRQKLEREKARQSAEAAEQAKQQGALVAAMTSTDETVRRHAMDQLTRRKTNPATGEEEEFYYNPKTGKFEPYQFQKPAAAGKSAGDEIKVENDARKEWMHANTEARRELAAQRKETVKDEGGNAQPRYPELQDNQAFEDRVFALTGTKLGYSRAGDNMPGVDEHVGLRKAARTGRGATGGGGAGGAGGDWSTGQAGAPAAEVVQKAVAVHGEIAKELGTSPRLSPQERQQGAMASQQVAEILQSVGGDVSRMSPQQAQLYTQAQALQAALAKLDGERKPAAPDTRGFHEKLNAGEAVTTKDVRDLLKKAGAGNLIDAPQVRARLAEAAGKFNRGELVTTADLRDWWRQATTPTTPGGRSPLTSEWSGRLR